MLGSAYIRVLFMQAAVFVMAFVYGCDDGDGIASGVVDGDKDADFELPWNPGDRPDSGCSDGPCSDAVLVTCDEGPCVRGTCADTPAGFRCACNEGYAGDRCDACSIGYTAQGLLCVKLNACLSSPCVWGSCHEVGDEAICACDTGYTGAYCDHCAVGYHAKNLRCVAD